MMNDYVLAELARLHHEELRREADLQRQVALLGRGSLRERAAAFLLALAFRLAPSITELVGQAAGRESAEVPRPI